MKPQREFKLKLVISIIVFVILLLGVITVYQLLPRQTTVAKATNAPLFTFDSSKAPGWWAGDPIGPDGKSTDPTASRNIVQGTQAQPGDCFITFSYYANNSTDPAKALSSVEASTVAGDASLALQPVSTTDYSMTTSSGNQTFQLNQFNLTGDTGSALSRGIELGFFKAGTGYIDIRGYCKTAEELSATSSVFSAITFKQ